MLYAYFCTLVGILCGGLAEIVRIDQGLLNGTVLRSRNGSAYHAFYGIPYAAPPVGPLRFKPPAAPPSWQGVRQATEKAPICAQAMGFGLRGPKFLGNEDCLYLSVFTKELNSSKLVPVLFYIHGGAYHIGSGDRMAVNPLMDKPVVIVTFNHRLGIFGFFASADEVIPGNYGLKDQVAAMKWVQKNIHKFGGDPNSVTIIGQSSGAACVQLHTLSPLSTGLFHKAIIQSGSGLELWGFSNKRHSKKTYYDTIKLTNCSKQNTSDALMCLQSLTTHDLNQIEREFMKDYHSAVRYRPVIESKRNNAGAFLATSPYSARPRNPRIPIIIGFNSAEATMEVVGTLRKYSNNMTALNANLPELLPRTLNYYSHTNTRTRANVTQSLINFYLNNGVMTKGQEQNLVNLFSDLIFIMPIIDTAIKYPGPKYVYEYDYESKASVAELFVNRSGYHLEGACHGDELLCLFYEEKLSDKMSDADIAMCNKLLSYWVNLMYTGNPNLNDEVPTTWPASVRSSITALRMSNDGLFVEPEVLKRRHDFWRTLPLNHIYSTKSTKRQP